MVNKLIDKLENLDKCVKKRWLFFLIPIVVLPWMVALIFSLLAINTWLIAQIIKWFHANKIKTLRRITVAIVIAGVIITLMTLNYHGFCYKEYRFIPAQEFIDQAIEQTTDYEKSKNPTISIKVKQVANTDAKLLSYHHVGSLNVHYKRYYSGIYSGGIVDAIWDNLIKALSGGKRIVYFGLVRYDQNGHIQTKINRSKDSLSIFSSCKKGGYSKFSLDCHVSWVGCQH